ARSGRVFFRIAMAAETLADGWESLSCMISASVSIASGVNFSHKARTSGSRFGRPPGFPLTPFGNGLPLPGMLAVPRCCQQKISVEGNSGVDALMGGRSPIRWTPRERGRVWTGSSIIDVYLSWAPYVSNAQTRPNPSTTRVSLAPSYDSKDCPDLGLDGQTRRRCPGAFRKGESSHANSDRSPRRFGRAKRPDRRRSPERTRRYWRYYARGLQGRLVHRRLGWPRHAQFSRAQLSARCWRDRLRVLVRRIEDRAVGPRQ